jgi:isomaltose glucohydrolase
VIHEHQAPTGAYIASPSVPSYRYSWFRDGAFVADAMSRSGETESAEAFFGWCSDVILARSSRVEDLIRRHRAGEAIDPAAHLHCRYTVDGREYEGKWSSFQLDGYGLWLWALGEHAERHGRAIAPYADAAALSARYVSEFWHEPCFDWWEERWGVHTATLASIVGGLIAASGWDELTGGVRELARDTAALARDAVRDEAVVDGRLGAALGDSRLDASLLACATPLRLLAPDDPVMEEIARALEEEIAHGGVHRYAGDTYYGGGEWLLLAAFLGWWYAEVGRADDARAQLEWIERRAEPNGDLPEQVDEHVLSRQGLREWTDRWGPSPSPLLWSHAMYLTLVGELGVT